MPNSNSIKITLLQQNDSHFAQVADWHHQECERQGLHSTLVERQERLRAHFLDHKIPKTLVLTQDAQVIGCVSLVNYAYQLDKRLSIQADSTPVWLSNLFVQENKRGQGFGNLLIEAAKKYAKELGLVELWLSATDYTDYYEARGWEITRRTRLGGRQVNVMRIAI